MAPRWRTGGPEEASWWPRGGSSLTRICSKLLRICSGLPRICSDLSRNFRLLSQDKVLLKTHGNRREICSPRSGAGIYPSGPLSCSLTGRLPPRRLSHPGTGGPEEASSWPRGGSSLTRICSELLRICSGLLKICSGLSRKFQTAVTRQCFPQNAGKS